MNKNISIVIIIALSIFFIISCQDSQNPNKLIQYGTMHEVIGQKNHQGRIELKKLAKKPHFFGIAALEKLKGEITFIDSEAIVTGVSKEGKLQSLTKNNDLQAAMLVGSYVSYWHEYKIKKNIATNDFDKSVQIFAKNNGVDISQPFIFMVEGEFRNVKLHVINGACPVHASIKNIDLPKESKPFKANFDTISGKIVGVYAENAAGNLTHPATTTHVHLVFKDKILGEVTAHVEQISVMKEARFKFPK